MIVDLLQGIYTELDTSLAAEAGAIRRYLEYYGSGDLQLPQEPPYMTWQVPTSSPVQYIMGTSSLKKYKTVEITFEVVTREKRKKNVGKCADDLKKLFERSSFSLPNGRVVDAVVIDDFCLQNTDSDGYTWYVGFHFEIGN